MQPGQTVDSGPKRFATRRNPVQFYVDDDLFTGIPALPAYSAMDLAKMHGNLKGAEGTEKLHVMMEVFSEFLEEESFKRFSARLSDKSNPIDIETLMDVIQWLLGEKYGLRPTQKPSPSDDGQSTSGPSSMDGVLPEASTQEVLTGVDSST